MTGYFFSSGTNLALFKDLLRRESKSIWVVSTVVALNFFLESRAAQSNSAWFRTHLESE